MLLRGKTALVYGGSGAVGGAVARAYAREGAYVVLAARNRAPLDAVAEDIHAAGGKAEVTLLDARDPAAIAAHLDEVSSRFGTIKVMFNGVVWDDVQGSLMSEMGLNAVMMPIIAGMTTRFNRHHHGATYVRARGRRDRRDHCQCRPGDHGQCRRVRHRLCGRRKFPAPVGPGSRPARCPRLLGKVAGIARRSRCARRLDAACSSRGQDV